MPYGLCARPGHPVLLGSLEPERARPLAQELGAGRIQVLDNVEAASRASLFAEPLLDGRKTPVFVLGDNADAKATLLAPLRTPPFAPVDAGGLKHFLL